MNPVELATLRHLIRAKGILIDQCGVRPPSQVINTVNQIRRQYIAQVGLKQYLGEMLNFHLGRPVLAGEIELVFEDGRLIQGGLGGRHTQPVTRYIFEAYQNKLPYRVACNNIVRYL